MSHSWLKRFFHVSSLLLYVIPTCVSNKCDGKYEGRSRIEINGDQRDRDLVKHVCKVHFFPLYLDHVTESFLNYDVVFIKLLNTRVIPNEAFRKNGGYVSYGEIHIENQHLEKIASSAFASLDYLREIHLSMNDLNNIEDNTFNIKTLEILDLSMNKIQNFSRLALIGTSNLKLLNLSSNFLQVFDVLPSISSNQLNLDLSFNDFTSFQFENTSGKVEKLNLSHNSLTEIKDCFPTIIVINLSNNKLRSITNVSCLSSPEERIVINLGSNSLSELNEGFFDKMSYLKYLYLDHNNLTILSMKIFGRLHSLKFLNISGNHLKNVENDLSENLESLLSLDLSVNELSELQSGVFDKMSNLKYLYLDHNNLTILSMKIFGQLRFLELLNISSNHLKNVENDLSENLESLLSLDLSFNELSELQSSVFDKMSNLKYLYLDHNNLTLFSTDIFLSLNSLEILIISHNHLRKFRYCPFDHLVNLLSLDLSYNEISDLKNFLHTLKKLENLNVEFNRLKQLKLSLTYFPLLRNLRLDGNEFSCEDLLEIFEILKLRGIAVPYGHSVAIENIHGTRCYENDSF